MNWKERKSMNGDDMRYDLVEKTYDDMGVDPVNRTLMTLFDRLNPKRIGDVDHAWIYIWTNTSSAGKLCLCVYLSWKMERVRVSVHTSQGVVSGLEFPGVLISHLEIDDHRGRVLLYDGNIVIAYADGPLDVRAKLITKDNKDEYVKMKE